LGLREAPFVFGAVITVSYDAKRADITVGYDPERPSIRIITASY